MYQHLSRHFPQDLAYKMVSKMGWAEGQGLGKNNDGITKHLWTKKRGDSIGIGAENSNDWGAHSLQTNTYNQLLSKLDVIINNSDSDSSSSSSSSSESDSDSDTPAPSPAKKGAASKKGKPDDKKSEAKKGKGKSSSDSSHSSDSSDSDSDAKKKKGKKSQANEKAKSKAKKSKKESSDSESNSSSSSDRYANFDSLPIPSYWDDEVAAQMCMPSVPHAYRRKRHGKHTHTHTHTHTHRQILSGIT